MLLIQGGLLLLTCERSVVGGRVRGSSTSTGETGKLVGGGVGVILDRGCHGACIAKT